MKRYATLVLLSYLLPGIQSLLLPGTVVTTTTKPFAVPTIVHQQKSSVIKSMDKLLNAKHCTGAKSCGIADRAMFSTLIESEDNNAAENGPADVREDDFAQYLAQTRNPNLMLTMVNALIAVLPFMFIVSALAFLINGGPTGSNPTRSGQRPTNDVDNNGSGFGRFKGFGGSLPDLGASVGSFVDDTGVRLEDVAGIDYARRELDEIIDFMKDPEKYTRFGAKIPRGVLLHGEPGTGKTLLCRALAGEAQVPLLACSASEFVQIYVGNGAKRVKEVFDKARKCAPCIVFIDEIDSLAGKRGASAQGNDEREATLNQLLSEMDGFNRNDNVIIVGATNRIDLLDPAILRPGRMDRKIAINMPDVNGRESILKVHAKNKPLNETVNLKQVAKDTPGMTGADLASIVNEAAIAAARRNSTDGVTGNDITGAFEKHLVGIKLSDKVVSKNAIKLIAVHEAGHAIVGYVENKGKVSHISTISTSNGASGYTLFEPNEEVVESGLYSKRYLLVELRVLLGGRVAEELIYGVEGMTTGASSDIAKAKSLASKIITDFGLGNTFAVATDNESRIITHLLNQRYEDVKEILTKNLDLLKIVAKELSKKRELTSEEFYALVSGNAVL